MRLQKNVGKRDWREVWTRDRVSEEASYRKSEDAERAGKRGRSHSKYFFINHVSTTSLLRYFGVSIVSKNHRPNRLVN